MIFLLVSAKPVFVEKSLEVVEWNSNNDYPLQQLEDSLMLLEDRQSWEQEVWKWEEKRARMKTEEAAEEEEEEDIVEPSM